MNMVPCTPSLLDDERLDEVNEHIRLIQKKQGLTFGTDAYLLTAFVRTSPAARAVDLGSGTGIIPLLLCASNKVRSVTAVELQASFADLIRRNAQLNGMEERISVCNADVREINSATFGGEVDLVCSNPPYLKSNAGKSNLAEEKEIVFIVSDQAKKKEIMKTVMQKAGVDTKAHALVFSLPVSETAGFRFADEVDKESE